jgi:hypothetical protein
MSINDWLDEIRRDVNLRPKQRKNVDDNNDVAKYVKIKIRNIDDNNAIIIVNYDFKNGTKTLTLYPSQRLEDFLTQITTKRDIYVLKYVVKTLKSYADMNNVLKQLTTFDLDNYYENNVKKRRVMLNSVTTKVNNVIKQNNVIQNDAEQQQYNEPQNNVNDYDEQNHINEPQNDNNIQQEDVNYNEQLLHQLRSLLNDLNNVNLDDVNDNDKLYYAANYVIQRFLSFIINVNNIHDNVIDNVINYLKRYDNNGDGE